MLSWTRGNMGFTPQEEAVERRDPFKICFSIVGRVFSLHAANSGSIPDIPHGSPNTKSDL